MKGASCFVGWYWEMGERSVCVCEELECFNGVRIACLAKCMKDDIDNRDLSDFSIGSERDEMWRWSAELE